MCDLCINPEKGRKAAEAFAARLEALAADYRRMANGSLEPHSKAAANVGICARNIVRDLVEEWV